MKRMHRKLLFAGKFFLVTMLAASLVSCASSVSSLPATEAFGFRYEEDEAVVSFAAVGDNLIHSSIYKESFSGGGYDFSPIYENVASLISTKDIAFVNQETPLGDCDFSGYPRFCSPYAVGDALVQAGFDVINIANNHMLDRGDAGLIRTKSYLDTIAEAVIGTGEIAVVERKGIKIAFLSYTYSTNCDGDFDVPRISKERLCRDMEKARGMAELVFVSMHWGIEYDIGEAVFTFHPTVSQAETAELLTELHADVIIGTHPHVLEGIEWKTASDGHKTLVVYSLGNFVSNMRFDKTLLGGILTLDIMKNKGYTNIVNVRIVPIVCHYSASFTDHKIYFLDAYSDSLFASHGTGRQKNEAPFCRETLLRYYESNIDPEFRFESFEP